MGKVKKIFRFLIIALLVFGLFVAVYFLFLRPEKKPIFRYAPEDAFLMVYTDDFKESWENFRDSDSWKIIQQQQFMDSSLKKINAFDSTLRNNQFINRIAKNHSLLISMHPVKKDGLKPIFYLDLMEFSKLRFSFDLLEKRLLKDSKYKINKTKINGETVYELVKKDAKYLMAFRNNVLFMSASKSLVKEVLKGKENQWVKSKAFEGLDKKYRKRGDIQLYANFSRINSVLKTQKLDPENYELWVNPLQFAVYNIEFSDDVIHLKGGISVKPKSNGYLNAFSDIDIGSSDAYKVISEDIATYISFTFDDFRSFNNNFKQQLAAIDSKSYSNYIKYSDQIEDKFDISIQDHIFNWIDDELVLGKLKPKIGASEVSDLFAAIRASNTETAKEMLTMITDKVSEKSPLKFRTRTYGEYEIKYLDLKGFFKLFAGNLFEKLDRPYYTILDGYVFFSNSVNNLITLIEHYNNKKTLEYDEAFDDVFRNFDNGGNVQLYLNSKELYESVYYHTDAHTQNFLEENRSLLMRVKALGIQVKPTDETYDSELRIKLDDTEQPHSELLSFEADASKAENKIIERLEFKVDPQMMNVSSDSTGKVDVLYPDSSIWYEGQVKNGKPDELWRCYYESGNLKNSVIYEEGKVINDAVFYYDNERNTIHIKVRFDDNKIGGEYREYYKNGQIKANINYEAGEPNGIAQYYYPNGNIKMTGRYKEGNRKGKWEVYNTHGKLIREIKY
jgi:antitoxin component YwqK of YwqJK toxin-antitoxin module